MIDLNGKDFEQQSVAIFNNGEAGLVQNVDVKVEKKDPSEPDNRPDFRLVVEDGVGSINQGFYYFTPNPQDSTERQKTRETQEVSRVLHVARAVLGADYTFPSVSTAREAYDMLFKLIAENVGGKKFNVFVTYGTLNRPNKKGYMGLRYFDFIEPAGETHFRTKPQDLMSRVEPDAPAVEGAPKTESWI